jgi:hypothetical protein
MLKIRKKKTVLLRPAFRFAAILLILTGLITIAACSSESGRDEGQSGDYSDIQASGEEIQPEEGSDQAEAQPIDDVLAAIQESTSAQMALYYDETQSVSIEPDKLDSLKNAFSSSGITPIDYPYMFLPEYIVSFDNGLSFVLMQDTSDADNWMVVLQFEGDETIYSTGYDVFKYTHFSTDWANDMAYMHIFENGDSDETSLDAAIYSNDVKYAARLRYSDLGISLAAEDPSIQIDDCKIVDMSETDPNLMSVLIEYSVKPESVAVLYENADLTGNPNLYEEDGWIRGNMFVGAFWKENTDSGTRTYILGLEPFIFDVNGTDQTEVTNTLYTQSYAINLIQ